MKDGFVVSVDRCLEFSALWVDHQQDSECFRHSEDVFGQAQTSEHCSNAEDSWLRQTGPGSRDCQDKLAILDETDSGLDIDALRIVANGVNKLKSPNNATIVITHYQRLLDYIVPDFVHVLYNGKIVKSGPKELALELEEKGYDWIKAEVDAL